MRICAHIRRYAGTDAQILTHVYECVHANFQAATRVCMHARTNAYVRARVHACMRACAHACVCACMHRCACMCEHMYVHM